MPSVLDGTIHPLGEFGHFGPESGQRHYWLAAPGVSWANAVAVTEPPFQLESHRYQTMQAADWIVSLVSRSGAIWADPTAFTGNQIFRTYFEARLKKASGRSGIRN
jgi:hypothetical protein